MSPAIGIDFGTSNTAAAILGAGEPRIVPLEAGQETLPTAIFLDYAARRTVFGSAAVGAMIDGQEGRFMRALKSVLGTPLARERRQFLNRRLTLLDVVAQFLAEIRRRAEAEAGTGFRRVVSGRPVRFHSADPERNAQAEIDLRECYLNAGFEEIRFVNEPEAAARAAGAGKGIGLIVDIGGGTSDFTLFESREGAMHVLASHGLRLGGTDFDKALSLEKVMPLLGLGGELRNEIGPGRHAVPRAIFHDLASWEKIAFLYGPSTLRSVQTMARLAVEPQRLGRLARVIENETGHDVAFAVEAAKIGANGAAEAGIDLALVERGLRPVLTAGELASTLFPAARAISGAIGEVLALAGLWPNAVGRVIFVGGSSLLAVVEAEVRAALPHAAAERSDVFTAVVRGLAICTADEA
ncbi:Hsp70 family protein [Defluviimonas sp. D31]|uniref:Hsp70 family protein n=1 Tax=Defluviimonas sp. D31 TaxID=3083253 RepID=UPI00296EF802|nr:Hsp70 family protein [Defluviimonas sp. D31]MDW4550104.1 Hsp70 family protein [Defluviimonas sp. D31]